MSQYDPIDAEFYRAHLLHVRNVGFDLFRCHIILRFTDGDRIEIARHLITQPHITRGNAISEAKAVVDRLCEADAADAIDKDYQHNH